MGPSHFWCHDQDWSAALEGSGLSKFQNLKSQNLCGKC